MKVNLESINKMETYEGPFNIQQQIYIGGQKIIVSSAYCRWVSVGPFLHISIPSHRPFDVAFRITRFRASTARSKRNDDNWSP